MSFVDIYKTDTDLYDRLIKMPPDISVFAIRASLSFKFGSLKSLLCAMFRCKEMFCVLMIEIQELEQNVSK